MKRVRAVLASTLVLLSLSPYARAQSAPSASATPQTPAPLDYGSLNGSAYTNKSIGLTLTLPEGWHVSGEAAKNEAVEAGKRLLGPSDPAKMKRIETATQRVVNLLTASQYTLGAAVPFNPVFLCLAERLPYAGMKEADYMAGLKKSLGSTDARVTIDRDVYKETVGGEPFSVVDVTSEFRGSVIHQRYYAHVRKDYALTFVISYATPDPTPAQAAVIQSIRLR